MSSCCAVFQVIVKKEGDQVRLIVDGIDTLNKKVSGGEKSSIKAPLHIGGLPADLTPASSVSHPVYPSGSHGNILGLTL